MGEAVLSRRPKAAVLYHYFHPDDVVSARHFGDFSADLVARGWEVEALPCRRGCRDESKQYPTREDWKGVHIRRVWRPPFKQASGLGRIANALWMIAAWSSLAFRRGRTAPDVVVVGTDPVLSVLVTPIIKRFNRRVKVAHWAYDLYPEAPLAEGMLKPESPFTRFLTRRLRGAYQVCDLIADLGPCMRLLLDAYGHRARRLTLVPWALSEPPSPEPPDPQVRHELFGAARLALLYSGNFGRAHSYEEFLALARRLRGVGIHFCFAIRGNRAEELKQAVSSTDTNVSFAGFASEEELAKRLASADIHLASLRPNWTGVVVPSKFFGSLAAGRPVLFAGESHSGLAAWIRQHQVGWELRSDNLDTTANALRDLADRPGSLVDLQRHCHAVYHQQFARRVVMDQWDRALRDLISWPDSLLPGETSR